MSDQFPQRADGSMSTGLPLVIGPSGFRQGQYQVSPAFAGTNPFVTVQGLLIGTDLVCILPASIYPRVLNGINCTGPSSASLLEIFVGSPTQRIDATTQVSAYTQVYGGYPLPPNTQAFAYWRNAASVTSSPAVVAETLKSMAQATTQSVITSAATQVGDTLYCFHYDAFMSTNGEAVNMPAPSGTLAAGAWTLLASSANGSGVSGHRLWRAKTIAAAAHTVQTNQTDAGSSNGIIVARLQNVSADFASAGQNRSPGNAGQNSIAPDIAGVTQFVNDYLFRAYSQNNSTGVAAPTYVTPAGYTKLQEQVRATNDCQSLFDQLMVAGATSPGAVSANGTTQFPDAWEGISLLVRGTQGSQSQPGQATFQLAPGY